MKRNDNWRPALLAYVQSVAAKPFVWGEHDCALFAAGAVEAMTGEDIAAPFRGKYKTLAGGLRMLKKRGFDNHADYAASLFEEIHPSSVNVGDIAALDTGSGIALGIVQGDRIYALQDGAAGISTVPLLRAKRAFRVPFTS